MICLVILFQATGCGTLLYPERKGQTGGKLDSKVVIMDGLLCLLFIIPGVVAFIVDTDNGCIYLPGGYGAAPQDTQIAQTIKELKLQFVDRFNHNFGEPIPITLENGSYRIENAQQFQELARFSTKINIYYQDQLFEVVELDDERIIK